MPAHLIQVRIPKLVQTAQPAGDDIVPIAPQTESIPFHVGHLLCPFVCCTWSVSLWEYCGTAWLPLALTTNMKRTHNCITFIYFIIEWTWNACAPHMTWLYQLRPTARDAERRTRNGVHHRYISSTSAGHTWTEWIGRLLSAHRAWCLIRCTSKFEWLEWFWGRLSPD